MTTAPIQFIQPPNNLRQKQKLAGVNLNLDMRMIDNAEGVLKQNTAAYFESINQDLARLQRRYEEAQQDPESRALHIEEIHAISQSIAGQGSSFGYPLLTAVATQLCHYIEDHVFPNVATRGVSGAELEVVKVHNEAMRLIVQTKMAGDGGAVGPKLVAGLGAVIKKVTGGPVT